LAGGVTALFCGLALGERDLVRIGLLVSLLPLVTAAWVARAGHRLGLVRTTSARQVEVGQTAQVHLELTNLGTTTSVLLIEEQLPSALGSRPRFVIDSMGTGWRRRIDYPVRSEVRGHYTIGPLRVRIGDPFGLLELHRVFTSTSTLVVTPAVQPLPSVPLRGAWSGGGDNRPRAFASGSAADVTVREYRVGDDLRRVHWRSSAHAGELMVRREEQPWQSRCTLLVDNRARAHRGVGSTSSLETAVSLTASIAVHLARHGYEIRLVGANGELLSHGWHDAGSPAVEVQPILERLAVLPAVAVPHLTSDWVDESATGGMVVVVLGAVDEYDRAFFSRIRTAGGAAYAVVLDVAEWTARDSAAPPETGWLQTHGWRAATLPPRTPFATAWQELGR
jgi:uncharacterized protein (DUF58 family)